MRILLVLSLILFSSGVSADTLKVYRSQFAEYAVGLDADKRESAEKIWEEHSGFRQRQLRSLLSWNSPDFPELELSDSGEGHRLGSAGYMKNVLDRFANELRAVELYDAPQVFDPSELRISNSAIRQRQRAQRYQHCKGIVGDKFEGFLQEFWLSIALADLDRDPSDETVRYYSSQESTDLGSQILEWIDVFDPKTFGRPTILDALGQIYRVDTVDGVPVRIRFARNCDVDYGSMEDLPEKDDLGLQLSMLISMRTGQDDYFVGMMECFSDYISEQQELVDAEIDKIDGIVKRHFNRKKLREKRARADFLKRVDGYFDNKLAGAYRVHNTLSQLSRQQIDFLIDLFLQFRSGDLPISEDFDHETGFSEIIRLETEGKTRKDLKDSVVLADYQFYRRFSRDLSLLENRLFEERAREEAQKKLLQSIQEDR